jgi:hypothetical protein
MAPPTDEEAQAHVSAWVAVLLKQLARTGWSDEELQLYEHGLRLGFRVGVDWARSHRAGLPHQEAPEARPLRPDESGRRSISGGATRSRNRDRLRKRLDEVLGESTLDPETDDAA